MGGKNISMLFVFFPKCFEPELAIKGNFYLLCLTSS